MRPGVDLQVLSWDSDWLGFPVARRRHVGQCLVQRVRHEARHRGCAGLRVATQ